MKSLGMVVLVACLLAGCTSDGGSSGEREERQPAALSTQPVQPLWTRRLDVIGQPVMADGVAVVLVTARTDELDVVGIDPSGGKVLWRHPYSPGAVPTGYGIDPIVIEHRGRELVVFQRPDRGLTISSDFGLPVVAVDPKSGREVYRSERWELVAPLEVCQDGTDACAQPLFGAELRFDVDDRGRGAGRVLPQQSGRPDGSRGIGWAGLYSTGARPAERIGRATGGRVLWEKPVRAVFGAGRTTDAGWSIDYDPDLRRYTGYVGTPVSAKKLAAFQDGKRVTVGLRDRQLVSFDARTGRVVWSETGVRACASDDVDQTPPVAVRCRISGRTIQQQGEEMRVPDVTATLEGYDGDGRTTWSIELSEEWAESLLRDDVSVTTGRTTMVVDTPDGGRVVDLVDGSVDVVDTDARFLCQGAPTELRYAVAWGDSNERVGGRLSFLCDHLGRAADGGLTEGAVAEGGVAVGDGRWLVATERGLAGYGIGTP